MNTNFPDHIFNIDDNNRSNYEYIVNVGKQMSQHKTILFCGIARNVADNLEINLQRIHRTGDMFKDYSIFIYENDSSDQTKSILQNHISDKLHFVSDNRSDQDYRRKLDTPLDPWHYNRCTVLANCRNIYVEYIKKLEHKPDYICVLDWDLKGGWSYDGLMHSVWTLEQSKTTGCVSAYGVLAEKTGKENLENIIHLSISCMIVLLLGHCIADLKVCI